MENLNTPKLELTPENIEAAYKTLGIEMTPDVQKSMNKEEAKEAKEESKEESKEEAKEAKEEKKIEKSVDEDESKEEEEGSEKKEAPEDKTLDEKDEKEEKEEKKIEKSLEAKEIESTIEVFEKSINEKVQVLGLLNLDLSKKIEKSLTALNKIEEFSSSIEEINSKIEKSLGTVSTRLSSIGEEVNTRIEKSLNSSKEQNSTIQKSLDNIEARVDQIEKTPNTRKSFENLSSIKYVEKSLNTEGDEKEPILTLSLSRNRKEVSEKLLEKSMIGTGNPINKAYENEVMSFESSGILNKSIMDDLSKTEGIRFVS